MGSCIVGSGNWVEIFLCHHLACIYCVCVCVRTELPADDGEKWETFISGQLADTNKRNTVDLVSNYININNDVEYSFFTVQVHVDYTVCLMKHFLFALVL